MRDLLRRLLAWLASLTKPLPVPGKPLTATPVKFTTGEGSSMGEITVKEGGPPFSATVSYVHKDTGEPATPADTPVWESADDAIATVESGADGMEATVTPLSSGDAAGGTAVVISVVAHDNEGDEVRSEGTVTVQPDDVLIGEITFAAAAEPTPTPPIEEPSGPTQAPTGDEPQVNPL